MASGDVAFRRRGEAIHRGGVSSPSRARHRRRGPPVRLSASRTGADEARRRLEHALAWRKKFSAIDSKTLSPHEQVDREWLLARIDGEFLRETEWKTARVNPGSYLPTAALYGLIKRDFAPAAERIRLATAREHAALANLAAARAMLTPQETPKVSIEIALKQMPGTLSFFRNDLPAAFAKVEDGTAKKAFAAQNAVLIEAIESYEKWLRGSAPKAEGISRSARRSISTCWPTTTWSTSALDARGRRQEGARPAARAIPGDGRQDRPRQIAVGRVRGSGAPAPRRSDHPGREGGARRPARSSSRTGWRRCPRRCADRAGDASVRARHVLRVDGHPARSRSRRRRTSTSRFPRRPGSPSRRNSSSSSFPPRRSRIFPPTRCTPAITPSS